MGASVLAFDALGGPLVALCGLTGGAGTSTLAFQLASEAAHHSGAPILLTEHDAQRPGLAAIAGSATPRSLAALADDLANGQAPVETFTVLRSGLRLIAAMPRRNLRTDGAAVHSLLEQARGAHGLVVVDLGTHWAADSPVLERATHVIWTVAATPTGVARAQAALGAIAPPPGRAREALAAACVRPGRAVTVRTLRRLAARRCERLVLLPYDERAADDPQSIGTGTRHAVTALASLLRQEP